MPTDTLVYILTGAFTFISVLGGVIWKLVRDEAKEQAIQIKGKADADRLHEMEGRFQLELQAVKDSNEKAVAKLEARHERDVDQLSQRLSDQIKNTETNILTQLRLMVDALRDSRE